MHRWYWQWNGHQLDLQHMEEHACNNKMLSQFFRNVIWSYGQKLRMCNIVRHLIDYSMLYTVYFPRYTSGIPWRADLKTPHTFADQTVDNCRFNTCGCCRGCWWNFELLSAIICFILSRVKLQKSWGPDVDVLCPGVQKLWMSWGLNVDVLCLVGRNCGSAGD